MTTDTDIQASHEDWVEASIRGARAQETGQDRNLRIARETYEAAEARRQWRKMELDNLESGMCYQCECNPCQCCSDEGME